METKIHVRIPGSDHFNMQNNEQTQVDFGFDHTNFSEEEAFLGRMQEGGYLAAVDLWVAHERRTGR